MTNAKELLKQKLNADIMSAGLCAKWQKRQGAEANKIRSYLKLTPKEYRKLLVNLSDTVETKMCANQWDDINFSHVPSVAAARYQKAFGLHTPNYAAYKAALASGDPSVKISAGAIYPYDVIRSLRNGDTVVSDAQWKALPNYLEGTNENILPVVDVSGSMGIVVSGSVTALDVSISLGLYLSERLNGAFKDTFCTFSSSPALVRVKGSLSERYAQMSRSDWGMSTDIQAVFKMILNAGVKHNVSQDQMPTKVLILSDMEFNQCITTVSNRNGVSVSAMTMIEQEYAAAGYKVPQIVFWNLSGRSGNSPVTYDKTGAALVSGFSPSIVKSVLGGQDLTPISVMLSTVMTPRYDF